MDANNETKYDIDSDRTNALQDEVDDAASDIAALTVREDRDTVLLRAQLDFLKYLLTKAQTRYEVLILENPDSWELRTDSKRFAAVSEIIAEIENDDYMYQPGDDVDLQWWMDYLVEIFSGDPETLERMARVNEVERSMGLGKSRRM